jgi:alanine-synthesizing transaminase
MIFSDRTNWNLETNRLANALARHRSEGKTLLDLTASNPTQCGFDYSNYSVLNSLANPAALRYEPDPKGLEIARRAVAACYSEREIDVSPDDILLTTGTSEAYSFIFRTLCNPGDEILIPRPSYPLFDFLAEIQDVKLVRYLLVYDHGWLIDFHALEQAITARTRGVILVHPNNPTGHFAKSGEISRLNQICSNRGMAIIADEVFLDFSLSKTRPLSFADNGGALTFTMSGLSKIAGLPQMKAAWLITSGPPSPKKEAMARLEVISDTYLSMNAPVQLAMPALLAERRGFQKQVMERVRGNLEDLDRQLDQKKSCNRLDVEGGWYAVLRVPATRSDEDLAIQLLETKNVHVHPGHFFDFPPQGYLVVSLITPATVFAEGIHHLLELF